MSENKEVKIAIIVGVIMITIILLVIIISSSTKKKNEVPDNILNQIKVYKAINIANPAEYEDVPCSVSTEDMVDIKNAYEKIMKLTENDRVVNKSIKGAYKIGAGNNYIAFDADGSGIVYRNDTKMIYRYNSSIYDFVKQVCE